MPNPVDNGYIATLARGWGKSEIARIFEETRINFLKDSLTGLRPYQRDMLAVIDEWPLKRELPALLPSFTYRNETYPAATVEIYEVQADKHDPRNPNPAAGRRTVFIVKVGERQVGGEYPNLGFAKTAAKPMHDRLVKALHDDMTKINPNFARF